MLRSTLYIIRPITLRNLKLLLQKVKEKMHLQENSIFTFYLDVGVKATRNVAQYRLHHVTYSTTKIEGTTSNRLGGDAFTIKYIIGPLTLTLGSI